MTSFIVVINVLLLEFMSSGRRIFQGQDAAAGDFLYVASWVEADHRNTKTGYIYEYSHICTCSILSPTWSLSAGHCISTSPDRKKTYILFNAQHTPTAQGDGRKVLEVISHPMYKLGNDVVDHPLFDKYDLCLLRTRKIIIERYAVLSAVDYKALIGQEVYVTGYGSTNVSSEMGMALKLNKPLQIYKGMVKFCPGLIQEWICITSPCGSLAMICGGDSGGPVIHASGIIGVNSRSENNCESPGDLEYLHKFSLVEASSAMLTPVSPLIDWISRITSNSSGR